MKVKAIREGYYKSSIRPIDEEFEIDSKEELGNWMEVIGEKEVQAAPAVEGGDLKVDPSAPAEDSISHLI